MSTPPDKHDLSSLKISEQARTPHSTGGKKFGYFSAGLGVIILAAGLYFWLHVPKPMVEVMAARKATPGQAATLLNASGYVTPRRRATVAAKITARVTVVYAEEGMRVKEGDVLARLDDSDAQVRLSSAKADRDAAQATIEDLQVNLANAERELVRANAMLNAGVQTQQAVDAAQTLVESYRARIRSTKQQVTATEAKIVVAQQDVDNCTVRAPFTGLVVSKDAQIGEMVSPISAGGGFTRTGIATVVDMNSLEVEVDVNESYIARVREGQPVTSILDAYPDWQIPSKVRTVIPTADRQKATVKVRISFDHLDPRILPDMGVKVAFLDNSQPAANAKKTGDDAKAAPQVLIPQDAVVKDGGHSVVFVVRDAKVERRAVSLGGNHGSDIEVFAGISDGDSVVVKPPPGLRDGEEVQIKR